MSSIYIYINTEYINANAARAKDSRWRIEKHMLIAALIIKWRLKITRKNIPGQVWEVVKLNGEVLNPQIERYKRGLEGSTVRGRIKWGEVTTPTQPQIQSTPATTQSTMISEIKSLNCSQPLALLSRVGGWRENHMHKPLKFPLRGLKSINSNALLNNSYKVHLRETMPAQQVLLHWQVVVDFARCEIQRIEESKLV